MQHQKLILIVWNFRWEEIGGKRLGRVVTLLVKHFGFCGKGSPGGQTQRLSKGLRVLVVTQVLAPWVSHSQHLTYLPVILAWSCSRHRGDTEVFQ